MTREFSLAIIVGTRPEIIKMAPIIKRCDQTRTRYVLIHTGQHYSPELDAIFFEEFGLPPPAYNLGAGSGKAVDTISAMLHGIQGVLDAERPTAVLVQGDTNSAFAGAFAANKNGLPVGHVEAGLRSYDRSMPEEINRVLIDHVSDVLFAPTEQSRENIMRENIPQDRIHVVGNTIVDVVGRYLPDSAEQRSILASFDVPSKEYGVLTLHRPGNVDDPLRLGAIIEGIGEGWRSDRPLLFFVHPRTREVLKASRIRLPDSIRLAEPIGYRNMLTLMKNAHLVLTDSGGLQEEACILGTPCVTIRPNTERPETLAVGSNILAGRPEDIPSAIHTAVGFDAWQQPFGSGASAAIVDAMRTLYG